MYDVDTVPSLNVALDRDVGVNWDNDIPLWLSQQTSSL